MSEEEDFDDLVESENTNVTRELSEEEYLNSLELIRLVQGTPALWNTKCPEYKKKQKGEDDPVDEPGSFSF